MTLTFERLNAMRQQLAADREACANSSDAQAWLDLDEKLILEMTEAYAERNPAEAIQVLQLAENEIDFRGSLGIAIAEITIVEKIKLARELQAELDVLPDLPLKDLATRALNLLAEDIDLSIHRKNAFEQLREQA